MDDRKIQKETREIHVKLSNGDEIKGDVYLRLHEAHHSGSQKVEELLNENTPFIPIRTSQDFIFVNSSQVVSATTYSELERAELLTFGNKYPIRIKMLHGEEIKGDIIICLPQGRNRVTDYLNQTIQFFSVFLQDRIIYINKEFILSVQE
jgi:hypothetical protein